MSSITPHPKVRKLVTKRIQKMRETLPNREELVEKCRVEGRASNNFDAEDCKHLLGPFMSEERAVESNQFLEMYLAQQLDMTNMAKHIISLNDRLCALNKKYLRAKSEIVRKDEQLRTTMNKLLDALNEIDKLQGDDIKI